jgi:hypothetical protein
MAALNPPRPLPIRILNTGGRVLDRLGFGRGVFDADRAVDAAIQATGLSDFGGEGFREHLAELLGSAEQDARLNALGRMALGRDVRLTLENRLRVMEERKRHPEIARERIESPLFILGLPRTSTSILHELLALDPRNRAPLTWEVLSPCPRSTPETFESDPRIARADAELDQVDRVIPDFKQMHRMGGALPQECVMLLNYDFTGLQYYCSWRVSSYQHWLDDRDLTPAYRMHHQLLQHFQSGVRRPHWVLKSPQHLWTLPELLAAYPDARIVQTHRDPAKAVASVVSLVTLLRWLGSDAVDPLEVGADWTDQIERALTRSMQARDADGKPDRYHDLAFGDFMTDPIAEVRRIYAWAGWTFSSDAEARMRAYLARHSADEHGRHRYRAEDYGLVPDALRERFAAYMRRFGIVAED